MEQDLHSRLVEWHRRASTLGPASSVRAVFELATEPLLTLLGFERVEQPAAVDGAVVATARAGTTPVAVVTSGWGQRLDSLWRTGVVHAVAEHAAWCLLHNGVSLRVVDSRRVYSRRYAEFELQCAIDDERALAALVGVLHARMLHAGADGAHRLEQLVAQSEKHATTVCRSLRTGVLEAAAEILDGMLQGRSLVNVRSILNARPIGGVAGEAFEQALTVVYRIVFLLFAEGRGLVPLWHPVYRDSYSVEALREMAEGDRRAVGLWDAIRACSRLAYSGCRAGDFRLAPFNGRLFAPTRTPLVNRRDLDDRAARRAVLALSTRPAPDRAGRERIAYRDLGVEQLGAVYETLLDYEPHALPQLPSGNGRRWRIVLEPGSQLRKSTGSFYTPESIARYMVRRTLAPLVRRATPERILTLKVLDPAMGSGAFLVAACGYLARAYESALIDSGRCRPEELGGNERALIRRTIAERCLFGVDSNPMAVQLARLSLWLATLAADRPLTFLDHHLATGDSLLGAWLSSLRRAPASSRRPPAPTSLPLWDDVSASSTIREVLPVRFSLAAAPNDTARQVRDKERALADLSRPESALSKWKRIANLWCASWFSRQAVPAGAFAALSDRVLTGRTELPRTLADSYLEGADQVALAHRFFHWELEFPEAFFAETGERLPNPGFDAVVGNPPWDMIRADSSSAGDRSDLRRDRSATLRFSRDAGVYSSQSSGHANRYQLFVERATALAKRDGRIGLILPSGLATDQGSAPLRRLLFDECEIDAIVGFDNRRAVFPIHRSVRFLLLTATRGRPTTEIGCRLGELDPAILDSAAGDEKFEVRVTPSLLKRISGEETALPDLRSTLDVAILERSSALFPPLGDAGGWGARFGRELNATEDRAAFRTDGRGLPVLEGKQLDPFRAKVGEARWTVPSSYADRLLGRRHRHARLAYRDVASATNRLTLIAAILPPKCVSTHTLLCLRTRVPLRAQLFLCGLFNTFVINYLVRLRVTTHVTTAIVERLPIPRMEHAPRATAEIAALARLLRRAPNRSALALLNALAAKLYQLSREEFEHVLGTFPLVTDGAREEALRVFVTRAQ